MDEAHCKSPFPGAGRVKCARPCVVLHPPGQSPKGDFYFMGKKRNRNTWKGAKRSEKRKLSGDYEKSYHKSKMGKWDYVQYLLSEHWKETKTRALKRAGFKCEACGAENTVLEVHHKNYKHLWHESQQDLEVLCSKCHYRLHRLYKYGY